MQDICKKFPVTTAEFEQLEKKFGSLAQYAAWQLIKKNSRNNHTDEQEDIAQELRISLIRAGSYYKRQVYIEACLELCEKYAKDKLLVNLVESLQLLWKNKTRHGASRQKFGRHQEMLLEKLMQKIVPRSERPRRHAPLRIDGKFTTYCKAITWNAQKSMGKKITREKSLRGSQVSLSHFDFLGE
jgi:hypothetical protein